MIDYGEAPSNQTALPLTDGYDLMQEVRKWIEDNPDAWDRYMMIAVTESVYGEISPNYVIQILRHRHKVSVRNGFAPVLARIAMEQNDRVRFRIARSKVDGYCEVKL